MMLLVFQAPLRQRLNDWIRTRVSFLLAQEYSNIIYYYKHGCFQSHYYIDEHYIKIEQAINPNVDWSTGTIIQLWLKYFGQRKLHVLTFEILKHEIEEYKKFQQQQKPYCFVNYSKPENQYDELMSYEDLCKLI